MSNTPVGHSHLSSRAIGALATGLALMALCGPAAAQNYPITAGQKATAEKVAQAGVPLSELAPNAPDSHIVKRGDTLWAISGLFLKSPWRWPELWGMNLSEIKNPHRIYPGQVLHLEKKDGRAFLRTKLASGEQIPTDTVRLSPRTRAQSLADSAIPAIKSHLIEPFLVEPIIVEENELQAAARIVAAQEGRVLLTRGDRAYARGQSESVLQDDPSKKQKTYRVFRNASALKDPITGEVLGYEAPYLGRAVLVQSEAIVDSMGPQGKPQQDIVPATIDLISTKEEVRVGDRLLNEPTQEIKNYIPHAPQSAVDARIVSVYGSAVANATQNQVVVINRGLRDGMESGHVLAILKAGPRMVDQTDAARPEIKLPDERNGLLMVFRTFERLSYGLVLDVTDAVRIGDRLVNPR